MKCKKYNSDNKFLKRYVHKSLTNYLKIYIVINFRLLQCYRDISKFYVQVSEVIER